MAEARATTLDRPFWTRPWFWGVLALASTAPFLAAAIPPMTDFPGHVGRYHIMLDLAHSADLRRFYDFKWALIGNLGVDLLMLAVGPVLGAERGAWAIAALTPALMVLGVFCTSRAVHGRVQPTAVLALPFVYANAFERGFLNYDLSVALALLALALWIALRGRPGPRAGLFIPLAFAIWVCHAVGWGLLGLMVGGYELQAAIGERGWRPAAIGRTLLRVSPLTPPALLSLGVVSRAPTSALFTAAVPDSAPGLVAYKFVLFADQLHDRLLVLDFASIPLILGLYLFARAKGAAPTPDLAVPAALVALAAIVVPPVASGIAVADLRIVPVASILFFLSIRANTMGWATPVVVGALALAGLRLAVTTLGWHEDAEAYARHLSALSTVPMGARILVLVPTEPAAPYRSLPMWHLADLAIVRRDALVNTQWAISGAQLLRVKANADTAYHTDPSQFVAADKVGATLSAAPLDHFDYVWVLGRYPAGPKPDHLAPVYVDDETRLFRIAG